MDATDLYPEMLRPYDPRIRPLPPPNQNICDGPVYTICINEFWWSHVSGMIARLLYRDAWAGTDDQIDGAIQSIYKILNVGVPTMGCGCTETSIPLSRIDENGHYQESDDGGVTWHDAPTHDPRNSIPRIPPYPPTSTANAKCAYADSVVNHFKEGFIDLLEEGQTVEEVLAFLTGIAEAVFGPLTGPIGWIVPAIFAIATAIVAIGASAVGAAFTPDFWNDLRCLIFCNMNEDGSFTQAQLDVIYSHVPGGAITTVIIDSWIAAIGTTGMTNAAHLAKGSTSTDCSACVCPVCTVDGWSVGFWYDGAFHAGGTGWNNGTTVEVGADYIIAQSSNRGDGQQVIGFTSLDGLSCCTINPTFVGDTPPSVLHFYNNCPNHANYLTMVSDDTGAACRAATQWFFQMSSGGPWQIKFTFVDGCP